MVQIYKHINFFLISYYSKKEDRKNEQIYYLARQYGTSYNK